MRCFYTQTSKPISGIIKNGFSRLLLYTCIRRIANHLTGSILDDSHFSCAHIPCARQPNTPNWRSCFFMIFGFSLPRWFYGPFWITLTATDASMDEAYIDSRTKTHTQIKCIHGACQRVEALSNNLKEKKTLSFVIFHGFLLDWQFVFSLRLSHWPCNYFFLTACDLCSAFGSLERNAYIFTSYLVRWLCRMKTSWSADRFFEKEVGMRRMSGWSVCTSSQYSISTWTNTLIFGNLSVWLRFRSYTFNGE